jgi:hypothetical protein
MCDSERNVTRTAGLLVSMFRRQRVLRCRGDGGSRTLAQSRWRGEGESVLCLDLTNEFLDSLPDEFLDLITTFTNEPRLDFRDS